MPADKCLSCAPVWRLPGVQAGLPRPGLARRDDGGAVEGDDDAQPKPSQSDRMPASRCQLHPRLAAEAKVL